MIHLHNTKDGRSMPVQLMSSDHIINTITSMLKPITKAIAGKELSDRQKKAIKLHFKKNVDDVSDEMIERTLRSISPYVCELFIRGEEGLKINAIRSILSDLTMVDDLETAEKFLKDFDDETPLLPNSEW